MSDTLFRVSFAVLCSRIGTQLTRKRPRDFTVVVMDVIMTKVASITTNSVCSISGFYSICFFLSDTFCQKVYKLDGDTLF